MKKLLITLILLPSVVWAQNKIFQGIIKDSETLQPIEYVTILFEKDTNSNSTGAISNVLGEFSFSSKNAKVTFSHLNYEPQTIILTENSNEIVLKPKSYILDEIIISKTSPRDYLRNIITLSAGKIDKNSLLKSYCREMVKINNDYIKFSDALVNYYVTKGNGKSVIILTEHRALSRPQIEDTDNINLDKINSVYTLKDYVKNAYKFEKLDKLLKDKDYDFERKIRKEANGNEYEYIEIVPDMASDKMLDKGYVIIDQKTKSILEYKIYSAESHLKNSKMRNFLVVKAKLNYALNWAKFKFINDQYILTYNKTQAGVYLQMGKKIHDNFNFSSDLFVYAFQKNVNIPENGYEKKTIFEAGTNYKEEFWKKYNSFPLTESEQKFIDSVK